MLSKPFTDGSSSVVHETFALFSPYHTQQVEQYHLRRELCQPSTSLDWVLINDAGDHSTSHSEHFTMLSWGLYSPWLTWHWLNIKRLCISSAIFLMPDTDPRNKLFQLLVWALCRLTFICFRSFAEITCWNCGVLCRSWCGSLSKWALARTASIITWSRTVAPF